MGQRPVEATEAAGTTSPAAAKLGVTAIMAIAAVTTATNALHRNRMMRLASDRRRRHSADIRESRSVDKGRSTRRARSGTTVDLRAAVSAGECRQCRHTGASGRARVRTTEQVRVATHRPAHRLVRADLEPDGQVPCVGEFGPQQEDPVEDEHRRPVGPRRRFIEGYVAPRRSNTAAR